jgi:UDP-N-acetyl-D-mannosaminuronic acid dehydrogenase
VIGLGEIGFSNAEYMTNRGLGVDGFDINEKMTKRALQEQVIKKSVSNFRDYDFYIICVSTHNPLDVLVPDLNALYETAYRLASEGKRGALVGIDSTITMGTANKIKEILNHRLHVAHVPHRYYKNEKKDHGVNQLRILAGCEPCCSGLAKFFYDELLDIPVHVVSSVGVAEFSKVVENAYRFVEIAFAEELKMMCDKLGIDFLELRNAVNTKWNIKILEAREGIGGHCLPKDSQMLIDASRNFSHSIGIVEAARIVDEKYKRYIAHDIASVQK